jgi:hypothetical protein
MFWAEIEPNGQITVRIQGGNRLVQPDTVYLANRNLDRTVRGNYGRYRNYGQKSNITA